MASPIHFPEFGDLKFEDRILTVTLREDLEITEQILEKIFSTGNRLSQGAPYCILADVRSNVSSTPNARKYGAKNPFSKNHIAYAMLADTTAVIILSKFFIKVNKPPVHTRLFKKEKEAIDWLKGFL